MIADAISKCKGIEKRPLTGTQEFLDRGKLCRGVVCLSSNADGLFRVPGMWSKGKDVCDICAESEPETKPTPPPQKPESLRFFSNTKAADAKPVPYQRHKPGPKPEPKPAPVPKPPPAAKPGKADVQALVAAELARVLPGLVRAEVRSLVQKVLANV